MVRYQASCPLWRGACNSNQACPPIPNAFNSLLIKCLSLRVNFVGHILLWIWIEFNFWSQHKWYIPWIFSYVLWLSSVDYNLINNFSIIACGARHARSFATAYLLAGAEHTLRAEIVRDDWELFHQIIISISDVSGVLGRKCDIRIGS